VQHFHADLGQMDPIVSLHYYAPVCAIINACIIPFTEGLEPFYALHRVGLLVLFTNAGIAFALNVAAVFLIGAGSGLILTLAGVMKDIVRSATCSSSTVAEDLLATYLRIGVGVRLANCSSAGLWLYVSWIAFSPGLD